MKEKKNGRPFGSRTSEALIKLVRSGLRRFSFLLSYLGLGWPCCGFWRFGMYLENLGFPLCGSKVWIMKNGCGGFGGFKGFSFNLRQKQQQHVQRYKISNRGIKICLSTNRGKRLINLSDYGLKIIHSFSLTDVLSYGIHYFSCILIGIGSMGFFIISHWVFFSFSFFFFSLLF